MCPSEEELKAEDPERQHKATTQHKPLYQTAMHEVVLIGADCYTMSEEENQRGSSADLDARSMVYVYVMAIERFQGSVRRLCGSLRIMMSMWLAENPQLELILLIQFVEYERINHILSVVIPCQCSSKSRLEGTHIGT
jgi:hypothetical protein